jgi:sulfotransferase family protein
VPNPYVFIVGCPRSGTTLLQRMVDAHHQVAITKESQWFDKRWITEWFEEGKGLTQDRRVTQQLIFRMLEHPKFRRLKMSRERFMRLAPKGQQVDYAAFVTSIFDHYGKKKGKPLVGNKTPAYVQKLDLLHKLWPETRFVHLIRDGRDVCLSVAKWSKGPIIREHFATSKDDPVSTAAFWWESYVRRGREAGRALGPELYYEVRYESLVARPVATCMALCAFLRVPYDDAMLRFHEGRTMSDPTLDAKDAWRPITPGLRDWKTQMPSQDIERFEAAAGGLLDELGYERTFPHPRPESLERAANVRELLAAGWKRFKYSGSQAAVGKGEKTAV